ncbi:MAG: S1 family peptidase [Labilithrix sp.]|nr:S1 family peptidase [Labilithrix sp.]
MARLVVLWSALVVAAGCVADGASEVETASVEGAVIGGRRAVDDAGAGYLVRDGVVSCSASLVEPDLVLTAAHCVERQQAFAFGWGEVRDGRTVRVAARALHPRYVMPPKNGGVAFQGFDVALLRLERPVDEVAPLTVGPSPESGSVRAIGYGATSYVARDDGTGEAHGVGTDRRSAEGVIVGHNATELFVRFRPRSSTCYGDSGGPLLTADGTIAAVLSRFTELTRCRPRDRSLMGYVRVDTMAGFFREAKSCLSREAEASPSEDAGGASASEDAGGASASEASRVAEAADVATCLREEARGLCAPPRFSDRAFAGAVRADRGDLRSGATTFELADAAEHAVRIAPAEATTLAIASRGDARMLVRVDGEAEPLATHASRVELAGGRTYEVVVRSCNGAKQRVTLRWTPAAEGDASTAERDASTAERDASASAERGAATAASP